MEKISILFIVLFLTGFVVAQDNQPVANMTIEGDLEENNTLVLDSSQSENAVLQRWYLNGDQVSSSETAELTVSGSGEIEIMLEVENSEGMTDSTTQTVNLSSGTENPLNDVRVQVAIGLVATLLLGLAVLNQQT